MNSRLNLTEQLLTRIKSPQKPAYLFKGREVSYEQMTCQIAHIATGLSELGFKKRDRLLLLLNDSPAFVSAFLGAVWIGVIPVPVNPRLRKPSLQHIISDSDARGIVCEMDNWQTIQETLSETEKTEILPILQDIYPASPANASIHLYSLAATLHTNKQVPFVSIGSPEAAFWQYTSGTTGLPKAVRHSSTGILQNAKLYAEGVLGLSDYDRIYSTAKMFFGYGLGNSLFFNLAHNATALLDDQWDPGRIVDNVEVLRPTMFFSVPAIYNLFVDTGDRLVEGIEQGARYCSAGSPLPASLFNAWRYRYDVEILDGIGATEVGHIFLSNRPGHTRSGTTGVPVRGYEVELRNNDKGEIVDSRGRGVLYVRGPSVGLGYHNDPARSAERFADGWYRTGDVFIRDETGFYEFVGREDDLFKVNGRWVAPHQIESFVLSNFGHVKETALIPRKTSDGLLEPVLFLAIDQRDRTPAAVCEVNRYLCEAFETYKLPRAYYFIDTLPKNDNGKPMRERLVRLVHVASSDDPREDIPRVL